MKVKNFLVLYKDSILKEHRKIVDAVKKIFDENKLKAAFCERSSFKEESEKGYDLILSIGGDGTLLRAAQVAKNAAIFGINSNPRRSEGVLCSATGDDLREKLARIINGDFFIKRFTRARILFTNSGHSYNALNEIYVGSATPYHTSRYILKFGKIREEQKSSGVIVATGLGSTAWYGSISKESFGPEIEELRFAVREPYKGELLSFDLTEGSLAVKEQLSLKSKMASAIVAIDSIIEIPLGNEEEVKVSVSPKPAKFIAF